MELIEKDLPEYLSEYASDKPEEVLLFDDEKSFTTSDFLETVLKTAEKLAEGGVKMQDYVALCGTRTIEATIFFLALQKTSAVAVLLDPRDSKEKNLEIGGPGFSFAHAIDFRHDGWFFDDAPIRIEKSIPEKPRGHVRCDGNVYDPANIVFTSGSTGRTKGVVLSNGQRRILHSSEYG